jgi:hypothetical protein
MGGVGGSTTDYGTVTLVADREGEGAVETTTDWVPAVVPSEQTTMTVYVPGETLDQAAD